MSDTAVHITINILNTKGDESLDLALAEALSVLDDQLGQGKWVFDDATNNMLTDSASIRQAFESGGSATVMPASVGG